ncbi:cytosine specific DNA methyltransferase fragment 3 [Helicobacter acinonychis]|uniref:Cytosine specific DNA methyltransferase 3 n=1 Tax=Helicobacter acinonychis (strain Sheeba) TaxID=382638 RepID=Q17ZH6_HELAH|nr:cytosine specific DNA methyltransferase fragment 3 [Helicobacter acinonychis str. Sheeba]STP04927.1 cytosine specific DNA methyltransferase fragment 3 [Helicobacter acinonychis]
MAFESDYLNPIQSNYQALMRKNSPKLYNHQATNHSQGALEKLKLIDKEQGKECLPKNLHGKQQFKAHGAFELEENKPHHRHKV